jgi:hypothetical protein
VITVKFDDGEYSKVPEDQFRKVIKGLIDFAFNEKEYPLEDISVEMIAEDVTGVIENHGIDNKGLKIIELELDKYKREKLTL